MANGCSGAWVTRSTGSRLRSTVQAQSRPDPACHRCDLRLALADPADSAVPRQRRGCCPLLARLRCYHRQNLWLADGPYIASCGHTASDHRLAALTMASKASRLPRSVQGLGTDIEVALQLAGGQPSERLPPSMQPAQVGAALLRLVPLLGYTVDHGCRDGTGSDRVRSDPWRCRPSGAATWSAPITPALAAE